MWPQYQPLASSAATALSPCFEQRGHIVDLVADPLAVVGPIGGQHVIADALAVDVDFVEAQGGDIEPGRGNRLAGGERLAEDGHGTVARFEEGLSSLPFDLGCGFAGASLAAIHWADQSPGFKRPISQRAGLLQSLGVAIAVPCPDLPVAGLPRAERLARIDDMCSLVRSDFAAVPKVARSCGQQGGRRGHQHLIRRLPLAALGGFDAPNSAAAQSHRCPAGLAGTRNADR